MSCFFLRQEEVREPNNCDPLETERLAENLCCTQSRLEAESEQEEVRGEMVAEDLGGDTKFHFFVDLQAALSVTPHSYPPRLESNPAQTDHRGQIQTRTHTLCSFHRHNPRCDWRCLRKLESLPHLPTKNVSD